MGFYGNRWINESVEPKIPNGGFKTVGELTGFIKRFIKFKVEKNKTKDKSKSDNTKKEKTLVDVSKIKSTLNSIVDKYNKDPNTKKEIEKSIKYWIKTWNLSKEEAEKIFGNPADISFKAEIFEENDGEIIFIICDNNQETSIVLSGITYDIAKELEEKCEGISCDTGDGDEGCIYVKY